MYDEASTSETVIRGPASDSGAPKRGGWKGTLSTVKRLYWKWLERHWTSHTCQLRFRYLNACARAAQAASPLRHCLHGPRVALVAVSLCTDDFSGDFRTSLVFESSVKSVGSHWSRYTASRIRRVSGWSTRSLSRRHGCHASGDSLMLINGPEFERYIPESCRHQ